MRRRLGQIGKVCDGRRDKVNEHGQLRGGMEGKVCPENGYTDAQIRRYGSSMKTARKSQIDTK
jgi:hypothetical protein